MYVQWNDITVCACIHLWVCAFMRVYACAFVCMHLHACIRTHLPPPLVEFLGKEVVEKIVRPLAREKGPGAGRKGGQEECSIPSAETAAGSEQRTDTSGLHAHRSVASDRITPL